MISTFLGCSSLTSLDVSNFNTSELISLKQTFYACYSLTSLNLSSFNTQNVVNMESTFQNCYNLTSIDLSNFIINAPKVVFNYMFYSCINLKYIDISNFGFPSHGTGTYVVFNSDKPSKGTIIVKDENAKNKVRGQIPDWEIKYKK